MNTKNTVASPSHPVWFPDWAEGLSRSGLPVSVRQQYRNAIGEFLRFCKQTRQRATVASARQFMQEREAQRRLGAADLAAWKEGVNWFFREAGKSGGVHSGAVLRGLPTLAAADLGRSEWEQRWRGRQRIASGCDLVRMKSARRRPSRDATHNDARAGRCLGRSCWRPTT
jgi:hypothetical protein